MMPGCQHNASKAQTSWLLCLTAHCVTAMQIGVTTWPAALRQQKLVFSAYRVDCPSSVWMAALVLACMLSCQQTFRSTGAFMHELKCACMCLFAYLWADFWHGVCPFACTHVSTILFKQPNWISHLATSTCLQVSWQFVMQLRFVKCNDNASCPSTRPHWDSYCVYTSGGSSYQWLMVSMLGMLWSFWMRVFCDTGWQQRGGVRS